MTDVLDFRLLMPLRTGLRALPGIAIRDAARFTAFWSTFDKSARQGTVFPYGTQTASTSKYREAQGLQLNRPLELITGSCDPAGLRLSPRHSDGVELHDVRWSLMDHGFGVVEATLRMSVPALDKPTVDTRTRELGERIAELVVTRSFLPLLAELNDCSEAENFLHVDVDAQSRTPEWVTRALLISSDAEPRLVAFAKMWIESIDSESDNSYLVDEMLKGDRDSIARWLNHVYRQDADLATLWTALKRAQFIWTTTDEVDLALGQILSTAMKPGAVSDVTALRDKLQLTIDRAQGLMMTQSDIHKYSTPRCRSEMVAILARWDFDAVLQGPVNSKIEACQTRIRGLGEERAARAGMFTDVILMTIGVTSIVATALALVTFGREAALEPSHSTYDFGQDSVSSWLASQPIDAILIVSALISATLAALFIWARQRSIS